jgi:hypothetical protein
MGADYKVTSPVPRDVWRDLMAGDPEAIPYQSPAWLDAICLGGRYRDASRLYEFADGCRIALPMVRRRLLPAVLSTASSFPSGWGMGGLLVSTELQPHHIQSIIRDVGTLPYLRLSVRPNPRRGTLWTNALATEKVRTHPRLAHVIDLSKGFDDVWNTRFSKETRSRIRKAEKSPIEVKSASGGELVPALYGLLEKSVVRWAKRQNEPVALARWRFRQRDPVAKLHAIAAAMGEQCRIWMAWVGGQPAAGLLLLIGKNVNDSRAAIDREALGTSGANDLIQKLAIEEACRLGCQYYHLGETGSSAPLAHYKERFGAAPYSYSEYYFEKIPFTRIEAKMINAVKWAIRFKD